MLTNIKYWPGILFLCLSLTLPACGQDRAANIERLWQAMELEEGDWVTDIGSREGFFSIRLAPIVGEIGHVFAVDINESALRDLHENIAERQLSNVTPVFSVNGNPMLPARSMDAILIRNTYHEFDEPLAMLRHIKTALKKDGVLVIAEPIGDDMVNATREEQSRSHYISKNYVLDDLKKVGFTILQQEDEYTIGHRGDRLWLIVAQ